ncbi:MAG TPA: hypothetical protein P5344_02185 [Candidatus Dojkabacteria bacterium]|nr:hypothetical protein [Candidatus Dojkabacteria bacterium]
MKFSGSKKSIIILIVCLFLLLISIFLVFSKDSISNGIKYGRWFVLDKYEDKLGDCNWERNGREGKVKCNALVYAASEIDNQVEDRCYNFLIISKEDINKEPKIFNVCEEGNKVKWPTIDKWLGEKEKMTPVKLNLLYEGKDFNKFIYSGFEVLDVSSDELFEEFYTNKSLKEVPYQIASEFTSKDDYNNYVYVDSGTFGINEIGHLYFFEAKLLEKSVENGTMYFTFETRIRDKITKIKFHSKGVILIRNNGQEDIQEHITSENIDKIEINSNYQFRFFYLTSKSDELLQKVNESCNSKEIDITNKSLCDNKEEILNNEFLPTTHEEILNDFTSNKTDNIINLNNGILFVLIK